MIISFSGRQHSGKTKLAELCQNKGYKIMYFADELKELVCKLLNIQRGYLELNKDVNNNYSISKNIDYTELSSFLEINEEILTKELSNKVFDSIRYAMQFLGTDLIRKYNKNWHIKQIEKKLIKGENYCFGDCRFINEKEFIDSIGGETWFIIRPNIDVKYLSNHKSELECSWILFDNIMINNMDKNFINQWNEYLEKKNTIKLIIPKSNVLLNINKELDYYVIGFLQIYLFKNNNFIFEFTNKSHIEFLREYFNNLINFEIINDNLIKGIIDNPFIIENIKRWINGYIIPEFKSENDLKQFIKGMLDCHQRNYDKLLIINYQNKNDLKNLKQYLWDIKYDDSDLYSPSIRYYVPDLQKKYNDLI
jgi:hypothetical protein